MIKCLAIAAAAAVFAAIRLLCRQKGLLKGAAVLLPVLAAAVSVSWEPLCLIPILSLEQWLNLPHKLHSQRPREGGCKAGLLWTESLTCGGPQVKALCAPFQLEGTQRRRGGDVLFNTAMALCCQPGEGFGEYAAQQGFDKQRLTARMPLVACWQEDGLNFVAHQDRDAARTFVTGELQALLKRCKWVLDSRERLMTDNEIAVLLNGENQMRQRGLHVRAFAMKGEGGYTYLGMAGTALPLRQEAGAQIASLHQMGARPLLMGRGPVEEVWAMACETGIARPGHQLLTQSMIQQMNDEQLAQIIPSVSVYVDLDRASRRRVVSAWESLGERVLPLGEGGLENWEKAIKTSRQMNLAAARLEKTAPLLTFVPCLLTLAGAGFNLWPLSAASVAVSAGIWLYSKKTFR